MKPIRKEKVCRRGRSFCSRSWSKKKGRSKAEHLEREGVGQERGIIRNGDVRGKEGRTVGLSRFPDGKIQHTLDIISSKERKREDDIPGRGGEGRRRGLNRQETGIRS